MSKSNRYHPNIKEIIALNDLAVEYYDSKDFQKAYNTCIKIYELEPAPNILRQNVDLGIQHMRYHMILGEIYYRNGNYPEAIKTLNLLKSLGKHFSDKYILLAKIHLKNGDHAKALQEYEEMIVECPQRFKSILNGLLDIINLDPFIEIATACEKKSLHNKAMFFYGKTISKDLQYKDVTNRLQNISVLTGSAASEALMTNINQKFENIEKIGEGNIWFFYKAVDKLLKRKVVITIIKEDFTYNPEAIVRFILETQYLSKAQHNGIVKIYDINNDILLYIVMEHIDGESLRSIKKKRAFSWKEVLRIAIDICDAIKYAHKHGVIHRDVRPDNIRLTGDNTVKISAFGLAHIAKIPESNHTNQTDEIPFYKSLEQIRGAEEEIDERSDIYSLGITLYELLTGHLPSHEGDVAYQHINESPKSLSKENPDIPRWLDKIILKCLEKSPSDRYQKMGHLQKSLESYSKFYLD